MTSINEYFGVAQFFFHCRNEYLPIRDIKYQHKTEPHYENLTENWCNRCLNRRIRSINLRNLDYLFLFTRYKNTKHIFYNRYFVVGYLKRASDRRFTQLSKTRISEVNPFDLKDPTSCGFFAGDEEKSKFVSIENAYEVKNISHPYAFYFVNHKTGKEILKRFEDCDNILNLLRNKARTLKSENNEQRQSNNCSPACRY